MTIVKPLKLAALAVATVLTSLSTAAFAQKAGGGSADGVIVIDQNKALTGSVTPGDAAGFPVTITQPGRYRLTSNLTVPAGLDGIVIAPGVIANIDMGGFSIVGPANCSKTTNCYVAGSGTYGIRMKNSATLTIFEGKVRGFTSVGLGGEANDDKTTLRATDMETSNNAMGAYASRVMFVRMVADNNHMFGLAGYYGSILESVASNSAHYGIGLAAGTVRGNTSTNNAYGYSLQTVAYQDNAAANNAGGALMSAGNAGSYNAF